MVWRGGGLDQDFRAGELALKLESGETIKDFAISYVMHGTLNAKKSNAILMVTAVSGMLTKPGVGLWSTVAPTSPFRHLDGRMHDCPSEDAGEAFPDHLLDARDQVFLSRGRQHEGADDAEAGQECATARGP